MKLTTLLIGAWVLAATSTHAQYAIDWFTFDGGGGQSSGDTYTLNGTIGQPDAGVMTGGNYSLVGGFWGVVAIQTPGAPLLSVTNENGTVIVCWPWPANGFLLERTDALAAPPAAISWSTVPAASYQTNGARIFITVPMPSGKAFYRLRRP